LRSQGSGSLEIRTVVQDHKVEAAILASGDYEVNPSPEAVGALRDGLAEHALTLGALSFQNGATQDGPAQDGGRQYETHKDMMNVRTSDTNELVQNSGSPDQQSHVGVLNIRV
jgi:hypothetical protein